MYPFLSSEGCAVHSEYSNIFSGWWDPTYHLRPVNIFTHLKITMFRETSRCNFCNTLYTATEICTIVWRRHTNTLLKFWNVSIRFTWLTIASNVLNRSFLAFHRGKLWQKNDFCQFFTVLHKITYDFTTKLHGPSHQISKKTKRGKLYNNWSNWKMLQNVEK